MSDEAGIVRVPAATIEDFDTEALRDGRHAAG